MSLIFRVAGRLLVGASLVAGLDAGATALRSTPATTEPQLWDGDTLSFPIAQNPSLDAVAWFRAAKPSCNPVEIDVYQRRTPPPASAPGAAYQAACYALAGRTRAARNIIDKLQPTGRDRAVAIVFDAGHPVADAGDDKAAGPIMELVVHYWPTHYMALYHAGMAAYAVGRCDRARDHLSNFLEYYHENDGWRANAIEVLGRLTDTTSVSDGRRPPGESGVARPTGAGAL